MRVFHELYILLILQILTELQILIVHWPGVACRVEHKKSRPSPSENLRVLYSEPIQETEADPEPLELKANSRVLKVN